MNLPSTPTPTTTSDPAADERSERFIADLADVRHDTSTRNVTMSRLGMALLLAGALLAGLGVLLSQATNNSLDQSTDVSLGLAGIAVGLVGLALFLRYSMAQFLRFWLLRFIYEQQRSS